MQTRVACPAAQERNFHIFYQLLYGITQEERGTVIIKFILKIHTVLQWVLGRVREYLGRINFGLDSFNI